MKSICLKKCLLATLGLSLASLLPVNALVLSEAFNAPVGGVPNGWTVVTRGNVSNDGIVGVEPVSGGSGNALRFQRPVSGGQGSFSSGALYYTGDSAQQKDFSAEVTVRFESALGVASGVGVMLRTQSASYAFNASPFAGYYVAIGYNNGLALYENPISHTDPGVKLQVASFTPDVNTDYLLRITAVGSTITASVWDATGTNEIASIAYNSAQDVAGYFGFRSGYGNSNQTGYFSNLNLSTAIPEPSAAVFLGLFAALFLGHRLLRRR